MKANSFTLPPRRRGHGFGKQLLADTRTRLALFLLLPLVSLAFGVVLSLIFLIRGENVPIVSVLLLATSLLFMLFAPVCVSVIEDYIAIRQMQLGLLMLRTRHGTLLRSLLSRLLLTATATAAGFALSNLVLRIDRMEGFEAEEVLTLIRFYHESLPQVFLLFLLAACLGGAFGAWYLHQPILSASAFLLGFFSAMSSLPSLLEDIPAAWTAIPAPARYGGLLLLSLLLCVVERLLSHRFELNT